MSTERHTPEGTLEQELYEQPEALERQLREGRPAAQAAAEAIRERAPGCVLIAARGSSDNAARYAQYLLGAHNRLLVGLATPSLFTLYETPPALRAAVVLGISQSGRSPDIVSVLAEARRQGALSIALTNEPTSPLAAAAELCVPLHAGPERAVAATKTYTASLCALAMLSAALEQNESRWSALARLPGQVAAVLEQRPAAQAAAAQLRHADRLVVIGRGFNYATAFEISLKLKETAYLVAEPYSSADFRHGPSALVERNFPVLLIAPTGRTLADVSGLHELCAERSAHVIAISDVDEVCGLAAAALELPAGVDEWLSPIVAVVAGQLFALELARARGLDPDRPRGLSKVTETR